MVPGPGSCAAAVCSVCHLTAFNLCSGWTPLFLSPQTVQPRNARGKRSRGSKVPAHSLRTLPLSTRLTRTAKLATVANTKFNMPGNAQKQRPQPRGCQQ